MRVRQMLFILGICGLLALSGCRPGGSDSPEKAAASQVIDQSAPDVVLDPDSIEVLQTQVFDNDTYVVLAYLRQWNQRAEKCLMLYRTQRQGLSGWTARGGGGSCTNQIPEPGQAVDPLQLSGGTLFGAGTNQADISYVLGRANDPAIQQVHLVWQDGQAQAVTLEHGTFLAIRTGAVEMKLAVGVDAENKPVDTINH